MGKTRTRAKIGTKSSTILVLWDTKDITVGSKIRAMEHTLYDSLHSHYRRLKKCQYWQGYYVREYTDGLLRVDL